MAVASSIIIVDYGIGNLQSVLRACEKVGLKAKISHLAKDIETAEGLILPGVGAFGEAMRNLEELNLINGLKKAASKGKPILSICLGMQLLMSESEESPGVHGLGIIPGKCIKFPFLSANNGNRFKVPQIQWNTIMPINSSRFSQDTPLEKVKPNAYMYFVHSYYVQPLDFDNTLSVTKYAGVDYCSSICNGNIFGVQFHPEKSGEKGLAIFKSFGEFINH